MEHFKTPLKVVCTDTQCGDAAMFEIHSNGGAIALIDTVLDQGKADADHIVRCVNSHKALIQALEWALNQIEDDLDLDHAEALKSAHSALNSAKVS